MNNHWYIGSPSSQLGSAPIATRIFDEPIALYRDRDGRAFALEDRCCHRGVQLSKGCVTDSGRIACAYHGWEYDGDGRCAHVPSFVAGTRIPDGFKVKSYPVREQDHYVWIWMGDRAPEGAPPRIPGAHDYAWRQGHVHVACNATTFLENMLDGAHAVFTHKGAHPSYFFNVLNGFKEYEYEVRVTDTGFTLFYPPTSDESEPIPAHADSRATFELPDRAIIFQKGLRTDFFNVIHMVPTGATTCRVEWLTRQPGDEPMVEWCDDEPRTLEQDRVLQESAQRNYSRAGAAFERHVPADYATLLVRKILELAAKGEWPAQRHTLVARKLVLVRQ
ncbi:Rieske 2Fe-2S domain-containing protein [Burkholderia sp. Bp8963]|uniref:Rieske 2Fe-2S domain-containing protein n=1 Tax=Burkholderia sp. Bp8963 TaxID=2184547 RepID=UPI00163A1872|nr:Rieske 2Fe-2S domain-containing protein [Burkholderia sp. Bp8963]